MSTYGFVDEDVLLCVYRIGGTDRLARLELLHDVRLTDRSQQSSPGLSMALLQILELAAGRLTASGLDQLLANPCLQTMQELSADDAREITQALQDLRRVQGFVSGKLLLNHRVLVNPDRRQL